jgi:hypothetical protein
MKEYKRNAQTQKILDGLEIAYLRLLEYKKKINSDLVIIKDNKVIHIKP